MNEIACHINVYGPDLAQPGFDAALADLAALGYAAVVLPPIPPEALDAAALRASLTGAGLRPVTMTAQSPEADVSSDEVSVRAAGLESIRRAVDFTHSIGGDQLNGVPYGLFGLASRPPSPETRARSAELVGQAADYAADAGVMLTFEVLNRYETAMHNTAAQALDYVGLSGSEHLRIHLDTFHMVVEEADMVAAVTSAATRLGYLELGQSGRGLLSTGAVDVLGVVRAARDAGYVGRIGVEAFSRPVFGDAGGNMLAIWRDTFATGHDVAADAIEVIRVGLD